jgi:hypothetical protein
MDTQEIQRLLDVSVAHSVVVDVRECPEAPGNLRIVTIYQDYGVCIEFDRTQAYVDGDIEGSGPKYIAKYEDLDSLVSDLEGYLGMPVGSWTNFTAMPYVPNVGEAFDFAKSLTYFEDIVRRGAVQLPQGARYRQAVPYFRHIAKYGAFRKDKVFEEQEEEFGFESDDDV